MRNRATCQVPVVRLTPVNRRIKNTSKPCTSPDRTYEGGGESVKPEEIVDAGQADLPNGFVEFNDQRDESSDTEEEGDGDSDLGEWHLRYVALPDA